MTLSGLSLPEIRVVDSQESENGVYNWDFALCNE